MSYKVLTTLKIHDEDNDLDNKCDSNSSLQIKLS